MNENYMNQMPLPGTPKTGNVGPVVAAVIIIAVLAFGGWYFWDQAQMRQMNNGDQVNSELQSTTTKGINTELEADLKAMENDDLGEGDMESVDNEFNR